MTEIDKRIIDFHNEIKSDPILIDSMYRLCKATLDDLKQEKYVTDITNYLLSINDDKLSYLLEYFKNLSIYSFRLPTCNTIETTLSFDIGTNNIEIFTRYKMYSNIEVFMSINGIDVNDCNYDSYFTMRCVAKLITNINNNSEFEKLYNDVAIAVNTDLSTLVIFILHISDYVNNYVNANINTDNKIAI